MKAARGVSASCIVIVLSACWLINLALARIPPGTWEGRMIITGDVVVSTLVDWRFSMVVCVSLEGFIVGATLQIAGTAPGVLFCVSRR